MSSCMNETVSDTVFLGKGDILRMISLFSLSGFAVNFESP